MDEKAMFDRFHDALDVEPREGAYERLRIALEKRPATPQRRPAFQTRWSTMGLRLVAVMTALVVAIAAVAAFFAIHRLTEAPTPARPDPTIKAYQALMTGDDRALSASTSNHCGTVQDTACPAAAARVVLAVQKWLDDLNGFRTPARFATIDAQMRRHLTAAISDIHAVVAANQSRNQNADDVAVQTASDEQWWVDTATASIADSYPGTVATYRDFVQSEKEGVDGCIDCRQLADPSQLDCSAMSNCMSELRNSELQIWGFQVGVVRTAAPASFAAKDARLQSDLAHADTSLIAMSEAMLAGDKAEFNTGRQSYQQALVQLETDATAITSG